MNVNNFNILITAEQISETDRVIGELNTQLGALIELSTIDRKRLFKMGRKNVDFVERAYRHATTNPEYLMGKLPFEDFKNDMDLAKWLRDVEKKLGLVVNKIKDSAIKAEAEVYQSSRLYYNAVKAASGAGDEVAEKISKDLSIHFRKKKTAEEETTPQPLTESVPN